VDIYVRKNKINQRITIGWPKLSSYISKGCPIVILWSSHMNNLEQYYLDHKSDINCSYNEFFGILEDFPGYIISQDGNVWSNKQNKDWKKLTLQIDDEDFLYIRLLDKNGIQRKCKIHRLIALLFIPNPNNKRYVYHKDKNKQNNVIQNLYWDSDGFYSDKQYIPPIYNFELSKINKEIGCIINKYYPNSTPSELGKFNYITKEIQEEINCCVKEYYNSCNN
jgi:hypothetical protein